MSEQQGKRYITFLFAILLIQVYNLNAQYIQLVWDASENPNISHYCIYRKTFEESDYTLINNVSYPDTTFDDEIIQGNSYLRYAVTAVDMFDNESGFSNIVEVATPPTPVELSSFSAHLNNSGIVLEWLTASESNNYGFEIQRSLTSKLDFKKIGFVNGNGTIATSIHYCFVDKNLAAGNYYYRLKQIDNNGDCSFSEVVQISIEVPGDFQLYQNYPNPFNSSTVISYNLAKSCTVEIKIFNINGQVIYNLVDEFQQAGRHFVKWEGIDLQGTKVPSGMYFYKINSLNTSKFRSMTIIK